MKDTNIAQDTIESLITYLLFLKDQEEVMFSVLDAITAFLLYKQVLPPAVTAKLFALVRRTFKFFASVCHIMVEQHIAEWREWKDQRLTQIKQEANKENIVTEKEKDNEMKIEDERKKKNRENEQNDDVLSSETDVDENDTIETDSNSNSNRNNITTIQGLLAKEEELQLCECSLFKYLDHEKNLIIEALRICKDLRHWMKEEKTFISGNNRNKIPSLVFEMQRFELEVQRLIDCFLPTTYNQGK